MITFNSGILLWKSTYSSLQNSRGNGYKLWVQWFLGLVKWTTLRYWSMVRKVTINQSWVTLVHTNDPWNRCAERLYPFPLYFWSGEQDTLNVPVSRKPDCPLPALLTDQNQKLCTTCSHQRECYEQPDPRNQAKWSKRKFTVFNLLKRLKI